jgi:glycosyltransferase involved in cell wall biosynthesis
MRIAILSGPFFHDCSEVTRTINGQKVKGTDRIIFGGAERYLIDLCELLQSMGHTVTVYQPFSGITKPFAKQYKGITFVMIPNDGRSWNYHTCTDLNWQFNELSAMDDLRIYFATYLAWPHAVSPCITISHGIYWDNIQGNNIINNFNDEQLKEFFKRQLYGFTAPDVVVSVDSNVRKVIQAMQPGAEKRIQIIYNYVDTKKFVPMEKTWEGINVLFPRRLTALRGSTEITRAFVNYPQYNFVLVGQAHDENAAKAFADGHKNRRNVTFTYKETDEMPDMYKNIDISVVPTIASEGLSLSLLESMASGLPVITTPVGGLGDAVIPGYNAFVYDPNHEDLGQYIDYLAKNPDVREKFGKRNREIAVECFDIDIWRSKWAALINAFGA